MSRTSDKQDLDRPIATSLPAFLESSAGVAKIGPEIIVAAQAAAGPEKMFAARLQFAAAEYVHS
jgi:hypothetical protein